MKLRQITPADFDAVRKADKLAWAEFAKPRNTLHLRTTTNILSNWNEDPHGCFLAEEKDDVLGYVFSHTWGKLGWVGILGVIPDCRGKGIGKKLLEKSVKYLERNGCTTIGLETRPENFYNVGMYISTAFSPKYITLLLSLPTFDHGANEIAVEWSKLEQTDQKVMIEQFLSICHSVQPGLDYTKTGRLRVLYGEGEIIAFGNWKNPWGFAVVRTVSQRVGEQFKDAFVEALVIRPGNESKFLVMLRSLGSLARKWGKSNLVVPVNTCNWRATRTLVSEGYRVHRGMLRMMYKEQEMNESAVNLSFWIM